MNPVLRITHYKRLLKKEQFFVKNNLSDCQRILELFFLTITIAPTPWLKPWTTSMHGKTVRSHMIACFSDCIMETLNLVAPFYLA